MMLAQKPKAARYIMLRNIWTATYRHFIFDLDGTLIDPFPDIQKILLKLINELKLARGLAPETPLDSLQVLGKGQGGIGNLILLNARFLTWLDRKKIQEEFYRQYSVSSLPETILYPWVIPFLEKLKKEKVALATHRPLASTLMVLKKFELEKYFDCVMCSNSLAHKFLNKSEMLQEILRLNPIAKTSLQRPLMVGDSKDDQAAARDWGLDFLPADQAFRLLGT
jgi:phosphoglycolate phosphatase-like HAD superfamily hydrolase